MDALIVSEVFGPTVQGEGPSAGQRCAFVRLGRCNLDCRWCDTPYTWDWRGKNGVAYDPGRELAKRSVEDVACEVEAMEVDLLVVSGGEPLLQATALAGLVGELVRCVDRIEVETNGTRSPLDRDVGTGWVAYNVSPKLASSGVERERAWVPDVIAQFKRRADVAWKFVVGCRDDARDVLDFVDVFDIEPSTVWIMPEGRTADDLLGHTRHCAEFAVEHEFNLSSRLQVLAWGNERGR